MTTITTWNDLFSIDTAVINSMNDDEILALNRRLAKGMDMVGYDVLTKEQEQKVDALYWQTSSVLDERYRTANEGEVRAYFAKYFAGKPEAQIDAEQAALRKAYNDGKRGDELPDVGDWGFYSDYHKDVFGYRPHGAVCGEYINPHW